MSKVTSIQSFQILEHIKANPARFSGIGQTRCQERIFADLDIHASPNYFEARKIQTCTGVNVAKQGAKATKNHHPTLEVGETLILIAALREVMEHIISGDWAQKPGEDRLQQVVKIHHELTQKVTTP